MSGSWVKIKWDHTYSLMVYAGIQTSQLIQREWKVSKKLTKPADCRDAGKAITERPSHDWESAHRSKCWLHPPANVAHLEKLNRWPKNTYNYQRNNDPFTYCQAITLRSARWKIVRGNAHKCKDVLHKSCARSIRTIGRKIDREKGRTAVP